MEYVSRTTNKQRPSCHSFSPYDIYGRVVVFVTEGLIPILNHRDVQYNWLWRPELAPGGHVIRQSRDAHTCGVPGSHVH